MFYSHTFLARKGPLGTVWCAAHLQHRLKKSHYTSTDITSTVDRIMFPEVPIALRMSSHLLLGIVRIYSKKVDYLFQDYNVFLIGLSKAFSSIDVNLPEDATHAPFHTVTLPDTFELDAIDLDYDFHNDGNQDKNLKNWDDITLSCDQIPTGRDPYITVNFDQDILRRSISLDAVSELRTGPVEEEVSRPETVDHDVRFRDHSPRLNDDNISDFIPEIEVPRKNLVTDSLNDVIPPDTYLEKILNNKERSTSVVEETTMPKEVHISPLHSPLPVPSPVSHPAADMTFPNDPLGDGSLNIALNPSPPIDKAIDRPQVDKPKLKLRKRKQQFDEDTVLSNKFMKAALGNCDGIRRKRKPLSSSDLDVWRSNNKKKKEHMFSEPLITGLASDLRDIYGDGFISTKPHLKQPLEEPIFEPTNDHLEETEIIRNYEDPEDNFIIPDGTTDISFNSPRERDDFTPDRFSSIGSIRKCTTRGTKSTETVGSEMETPSMDIMYDYQGIEPYLPPIPEDMGSAEVDDLNFLASEDYTPSKFQRTEGLSSLSGTTRKVAQFLKEKYSPISEDLEGNLSMNELLEGKNRKVCARMFFETMVLKCDELVDVEQEEAYGDIKLRLTAKLFKDQN